LLPSKKCKAEKQGYQWPTDQQLKKSAPVLPGTGKGRGCLNLSENRPKSCANPVQLPGEKWLKVLQILVGYVDGVQVIHTMTPVKCKQD